MRLIEIVNGMNGAQSIDPAFRNLDIRGLAVDSRAVGPGYLFAALPGTVTDGSRFIPEALARGAVAVLGPDTLRVERFERPVAVITDPNPRQRLARMAARFYERQPRVTVGVTGTNGKTSVASFTRQLWGEIGYQAASMGTLGTVAPGLEPRLGLTTPNPVALHEELAGLAGAGIEHLAMEASSHGLEQYRVDGVRFAAAAFTNLSRDHLDYHGTMEAYLRSKARLFDEVMVSGGGAVLNADSPEFDSLGALCRARRHRIIGYGSRGTDIRLDQAEPTAAGLNLEFTLAGRTYRARVGLIGGFQAMNLLAAIGLILATEGEVERAIAALPHVKSVPGRVDLVGRVANGGAVFVDYAHTPDALASVLEALRPHTTGRLIVAFGCGGDRDAGKRPQMGAAARRHADLCIVTDDNPRGEDPAVIRRAVLAACPDAREIGDRAEAIAAGIGTLEAGDVFLIAGKGHERGQTVGKRVLPFDDSEIARTLIAERDGGAS